MSTRKKKQNNTWMHECVNRYIYIYIEHFILHNCFVLVVFFTCIFLMLFVFSNLLHSVCELSIDNINTIVLASWLVQIEIDKLLHIIIITGNNRPWINKTLLPRLTVLQVRCLKLVTSHSFPLKWCISLEFSFFLLFLL